MKRPVWNYRVEATTNAPIDVVAARLGSLPSAFVLSVCCPRRGQGGGWVQESASPTAELPGLQWTARCGGLTETARFSAEPEGAGCRLRAEGRLKGWPLLWRLPLLEWRSEGLLRRFVASL